MLLDGLEEMVRQGINPIREAIKRLNDPQLAPRFQMDALRMLFGVCFGQKQTIEFEPPDPVDEERIASVRRVVAGLFMEEAVSGGLDAIKK